MRPTAPSSRFPAATAKDDRTRWIALVVLCVGMLMIILDATIVNVALPSIQTDLGFSQSDLAWVVNAYLIAFGGLLLLAGRLGDLIGRRRMFLLGLAVFTAASLACGVAQSQEVLIAARFVQGVGGAMTSAVILGMIVTMFPQPREQAKAIGVYSFVASAGASIGLLAGGALTEAINWHWIFFVNLPIGIATALFAVRLLERDEGIGLSQGADVPGAALVIVNRIASLRDLIESYDRQIHDCDVRIYRRLKGHPGYEAIQALRGVGPVLAAVFIAEIGDVSRFGNARRLCSWAGLTPRHRESDSHVARGRISKQGSRLLRWACVEAVSGAVRDPQDRLDQDPSPCSPRSQHRPRRRRSPTIDARLLRTA